MQVRQRRCAKLQQMAAKSGKLPRFKNEPWGTLENTGEAFRTAGEPIARSAIDKRAGPFTLKTLYL